MKHKKQTILITGMALLLVAAFSGCTRDKVGLPDPVGPSTLATILKVTASPNVLAAVSDTRQTTTITANLYKFDGSPVAGKTVHFEIRDASGFKSYLGFLDGSQTVVSKSTDGSGRVTITYNGPLASELEVFDNFILYIYAYVGWQGKEEISDLCPVRIVGDVLAELDLEFELQAIPNVLWCSSVNPTSTIRGIFTFQNGVPIVGRKVYFKILSGPAGAEGKFEDGFAKTFAVTDENGVAEVIYIGPTRDQLPYDDEVEIQGQPETDWIHVKDPYDELDDPSKYYMHKEMKIRLIKGTGAN